MTLKVFTKRLSYLISQIKYFTHKIETHTRSLTIFMFTFILFYNILYLEESMPFRLHYIFFLRMHLFFIIFTFSECNFVNMHICSYFPPLFSVYFSLFLFSHRQNIETAQEKPPIQKYVDDICIQWKKKGKKVC